MTRQLKASPLNDEAKLPAKISYKEFLHQYDGQPAEWVDGRVIVMAPVSSGHQFLSRFLIRVFAEVVEYYALGEIFFEMFNMKMELRPSGRNPDIMFVSNANLHRIKSNYLDGAADLIVEIISPDNPDRDRDEKFREYAAAGVREYWLVDPSTKRADFYLLDSAGKYQAMAVTPDGVFRSQVIPALWIHVEWLWERPPLREVRVALGLI